MATEGGGAKPVTQSRMENFRKVRTSEEESPLPFPDLPPDVVEMKVKEGSKIRNLMNFAMAQMELKGSRQIVFSGCGRAVTKTITCVEINPNQTGYQPPEPWHGLGTQLGEAGEDTSSSSTKGLKRPLPPPREELLTKKLQVQVPDSPGPPAGPPPLPPPPPAPTS
ncbi:PREDICTED: ribonuclease P protein subunit p25-like, partial [Fulmarus glacialis]|uniref:ribonuclease P protein subunit p25-like n=1 Tax=Fulmarus glacialis TaxID=30455 RepID=UPI00051BCB62